MKTTEEKTVKDWLNTLNEPYKTKAINQTNKDILNLKCNSMSDALLRMFHWERSLEGCEYWNDLHESLENKEI